MQCDPCILVFHQLPLACSSKPPSLPASMYPWISPSPISFHFQASKPPGFHQLPLASTSKSPSLHVPLASTSSHRLLLLSLQSPRRVPRSANNPPALWARACRILACLPFLTRKGLLTLPYQEGFTLPFSFPDWLRASRRGFLESQIMVSILLSKMAISHGRSFENGLAR